MLVALAALALAAVAASATAAARPPKHPRPQAAAFPTWSPDGKQFAFVYRISSSRYRIVRTSSKSGGAVDTVLRAKGHCCAQLLWAADGRVLFDPSGGLKSVHVPDGKPQRVLLGSCGIDRNPWGCSTLAFFLSPNHQYAAVDVSEDPSDPHSTYGVTLVKMSPGRTPAELTTPLPAEESRQGVIDSALSFSPDGKQLVFSRASWDDWGDEGPPALMAFKIGAGASVPLAQSGIPGASLLPSDAAQIEWSPNGTWVAYDEYDSTEGTQSLEVVPTTGQTMPRVLAPCDLHTDFGFAWSPTAKLIAYHCGTGFGNSGQLVTVKPDGSDSTDLLKGRRLGYIDDGLDDQPQ
jgi:Tol biopolymer transport system component